MIALVPLVLLAGFVWQGTGSGSDEDAGDRSFAEVATTASSTATPTPTATMLQQTAAPALPTQEPPQWLNVPPPEISATAAIVMDDASLEVLYQENAFERRAPASLTKIATAIVATEQGRMEEMATSDVHYWDLEDSTAMALEPGDEVSMLDLVYGLMLVSGNDTAQVIAKHLSGSEEAFVGAMNLLVERLELRDTQFRNAHGLTEDGHYSTAYDLAILSQHLMQYPILREVVGTEQVIVEGLRDGEPVEFDLYNHNPLLNYTEGVDGVKTGFTEEAGRTYAASVERDGRRVYIVLLDAYDRAQDAIELIDWVYEAHVWPGDDMPDEPPEPDASPEPVPEDEATPDIPDVETP